MTPWTALHARLPCPSLSPGVCSNSHPSSQLPYNHLIFSHPLVLLPSIFPSIRVFSNELTLCVRWPKYWNFSFSNSLSNEYSGLISLGLTGLISLLLKGCFKSLLQHHTLKASILPVWVNNYTFKYYSFRLKCESRPAVSVGRLYSECNIRTKLSFISAENLNGLLVLGNLKTQITRLCMFV